LLFASNRAGEIVPPPVQGPPLLAQIIAPASEPEKGSPPLPEPDSQADAASPANAAPEDERHEDHPALARFRELTRYPESSRRLTANSFDLLEPNRRYENRQPLSDARRGDEAGWEVRYTADRYYIRGDEAAEISFELWFEGEAVRPQHFSLSAVAKGRQVPLRFEREGARYVARFTPADSFPHHLGRLTTTARFSARGLSEKTGALSFFFTPADRIPARFTGVFGDRLVSGNLIVDVGLEIDQPGLYRIEGNLYGRHGAPVAAARYQGELALGSQRAPLVFFGLIFHDALAEGPFVLKQVRGHRMRPGHVPDREDLVSHVGQYEVKERYVLSDFSRAEHESAHKERMLARYRDALDRGVRLMDSAGH